MESLTNSSISVDIPNYSGPLETLLDLAKNQKVDLTKISITKLAENFLEYVKESEDKNLDTAFEYLIMATWLAYLKSKLLLPDDDDDNFKASEIAEKLKVQLKKLELIRLLSDQLLKRDRIGKNIFYRGTKGGIRSIRNPVYKVTLYELLKSYSDIKDQYTFQKINIPKLPVLTTQEAIKFLKNNFNLIDDWKNIGELVPSSYSKSTKLKKSGLAAMFSASLELSKEGVLNILQEKLFDDILIRSAKHTPLKLKKNN